jgi:hypothetical protein
MSKAWCKHTPDSPCPYCQDKHDEREWITTFAADPHGRWLERKRAVELRTMLEEANATIALANKELRQQYARVDELKAQLAKEAGEKSQVEHPGDNESPQWRVKKAVAGAAASFGVDELIELRAKLAYAEEDRDLLLLRLTEMRGRLGQYEAQYAHDHNLYRATRMGQLEAKLAEADEERATAVNAHNIAIDCLTSVQRELEALRAVEQAARAVGCGHDEVSPISIALIALDALRKEMG